MTLGIEAGTWTVRIGDETREGFTVADGPRLVTFAAPLPPYRLVVTSGGDVLIDTTVKAEHVNDWPCEPATDDSSTGDELILPVTGPSDVLLALGALGTFLVVGGGTLLFSRAGKE